jgi:glutamyl-tRNA synthetase
MSMADVVEAFSLDGVTHAAAAFDHQKLDWVNGEWIRRLTIPELEARALPLAEARFGASLDRGLLRQVLELGQERSVTVGDLLDQAAFLFVDDADFSIDDATWAKVAAIEDVTDVLALVDAHLETCEWTADGVNFNDALKAAGYKVRKVIPAAYVAIEGRPTGLPLFDSLVLLGPDRARARISAARARLE